MTAGKIQTSGVPSIVNATNVVGRIGTRRMPPPPPPKIDSEPDVSRGGSLASARTTNTAIPAKTTGNRNAHHSAGQSGRDVRLKYMSAAHPMTYTKAYAIHAKELLFELM